MVYHTEHVRKYRQEQFSEMGFNKPMAKLLALSGTDTHRARKMLDQGCPHELVTAIFLDGDEHEAETVYEEATS